MREGCGPLALSRGLSRRDVPRRFFCGASLFWHAAGNDFSASGLRPSRAFPRVYIFLGICSCAVSLGADPFCPFAKIHPDLIIAVFRLYCGRLFWYHYERTIVE